MHLLHHFTEWELVAPGGNIAGIIILHVLEIIATVFYQHQSLWQPKHYSHVLLEGLVS